jgi:hypothetical protein
MGRKIRSSVKKGQGSPVDFADAATVHDASYCSCAVSQEAHDDVEAELGILVKQQAHAVHFGITEGQGQAESEVAARRSGRCEHNMLLVWILDGVPQISGPSGGPIVDRKYDIVYLQPARPAPPVRLHCSAHGGSDRRRGEQQQPKQARDHMLKYTHAHTRK